MEKLERANRGGYFSRTAESGRINRVGQVEKDKGNKTNLLLLIELNPKKLE